MRPCQLGRKLRHNLFFWYLSDACEIRRHLCAIRYLIQGWSQEVETCNPSSRNSSHKLPQIWLSLRPPIFNSQIHTDGGLISSNQCLVSHTLLAGRRESNCARCPNHEPCARDPRSASNAHRCMRQSGLHTLKFLTRHNLHQQLMTRH